VYYSSSYSNCLRIKSEYEPNGASFVLPVGPGLTKSMADARNPAGETSYRELVINLIGTQGVTVSYLVRYDYMRDYMRFEFRMSLFLNCYKIIFIRKCIILKYICSKTASLV
jgi:hypothetical protein